MFTVDKLLKYGRHYQGSLRLAETAPLIFESHWPESLVLIEEFESLIPAIKRTFETVKGN